MASRVTFRSGDRAVSVELRGEGTVAVDGAVLRAAAGPPGLVVVEGAKAWVAGDGETRWVYLDGCVHAIEVRRPDGPRRRGRHHGSLSAPMPATVRQIRVEVGSAVARGDTLIVLEAMKMELPVRANADGTVTAVHCREGELVQPGRPLVEVAGPAEG